MRKALLATAIGVFVLGGTVVVAAQTDESDEVTATTRVGTAISQVLDELVADGTLTEDQAAAVTEALVARHEQRIAERQAVREQIQDFWSDGELTEEELAELPDTHHWNRLSDMLEDGTITRDELAGIHPGRGGGFGFRHRP